MASSTERALLGRSIPTDLVAKVVKNGHTVSFLRSADETILSSFYGPSEIDLLKQKVNREPIDDQILNQIMDDCDSSCAYCKDGNSSRPYQIHHIDLYSETQDNSADNLFILCPTHHANVHKNKTPKKDQKKVRSEWGAIVEISKSYKAKNISFPYQAWEPITYDGDFGVEGLFELGDLSPSLAVDLHRNDYGRSALHILENKNCLFIVGRPGSGKTSLGVGVGGLYREKIKCSVFRYKSSEELRKSVQEVLTFISVCAHPCVIFLDNINTWSDDAGIESIRKSGSELVKVIMTGTRDSVGGGGNWDFKFSDCLLDVSWAALSPYIKRYLMDHEVEVTGILRSQRGDEGRFSGVGIGSLSRSLRNIIKENDRPEVQTAQQFISSLNENWRRLEAVFKSLLNDDRADIPVLCAAIEQIAGIERPVSIPEIMHMYNELKLDSLPVSPDWISQIFERMVDAKIMVSVRDRFTTFHRTCALSLLGNANFYNNSKKTLQALFDHNFNYETVGVKRLLIVWSWFESSGYTRDLVTTWVRNQTTESWLDLIESCAKAGIFELGWIFDYLHSSNLSQSQDGFKGILVDRSAPHIIGALQKIGVLDWYHLDRVFVMMRYSDSRQSAQILSQCSPKHIAELISKSHPKYFSNISGFLYSAGEIKKEWCLEVGEHIVFDDLLNEIAAIEKGQLDDLFSIFEVLHRIKFPPRRSHLTKIVDAASNVLHQVPLSEMRLCPVMIPLEFRVLSEELRKILSPIKASLLVDDLNSSFPRDWRPFGELSHLFEMADLQTANMAVELLGETFVERVKNIYSENPYDLRVLLWSLVRSEQANTRKIIDELFPSILEACRENKTEAKEIMKALGTFDSAYAQKISNELELELPEIPPKERFNLPEEAKTAIAEAVSRLVAEKADYLISELLK